MCGFCPTTESTTLTRQTFAYKREMLPLTNTHMHTHQASLSTTFPDHEVSYRENVICSVTQISQEHDHKGTEWGHSTSPESIFSSLCDTVH